jgi:hypothetical protein
VINPPGDGRTSFESGLFLQYVYELLDVVELIALLPVNSARDRNCQNRAHYPRRLILAKSTEAAEQNFLIASKHVRLAGGKLMQSALSAADRQIADAEMARAMYYLTVGLGELSAGLRATYMLLEQVQAAQHLPFSAEFRRTSTDERRKRA